VEVGASDQGQAAQAMARAGLAAIETRPDLQGIPRIVSGRRPQD
jgi:hypothetical protein